jgi:hypothetical protein
MLKMIVRPMIVQTIKTPSCKTCKFYQQGDCTAFATQDPVSGQLMHTLAIKARRNLRMCGPEGFFWSSQDSWRKEEPVKK